MGKRFMLLALMAMGCSAKLESGYDPKPLNMSLAERRALYADPYSQQAQEALQDQGTQSQMHKPGTP